MHMEREVIPSELPLTEEQLADNLNAIRENRTPLHVQNLGRCATMQGGSADRTLRPRAGNRPPTQTTGRSPRIRPLKG